MGDLYFGGSFNKSNAFHSVERSPCPGSNVSGQGELFNCSGSCAQLLPSTACASRLAAAAVLVGVAVAVDIDLLGLPATATVEARALAVLALLATASEHIPKDTHGAPSFPAITRG